MGVSRYWVVCGALAILASSGAQAQVAPTSQAQNPTEAQPPRPEGLDVEYRTVVFDVPAQTITYSGGVVARYGPTVVRSERLTVFLAETKRRAIAELGVVLEDPEGTVQASRLEIWWDERRASASGARVRVAGLEVDADSIEVSPARWVLSGVRVESTNRVPFAYGLRSRQIVVEPGRRATLRHATALVGGRSVLGLPKAEFSLAAGTRGLSLPTLAFQPSDPLKPGIGWRSAVPLSLTTVAAGEISTAPGRVPSSEFSLALSGLPIDQRQTPVPPRSDLDERGRFGYFDNVSVESPAVESATLREKRRTVALTTAWNLRAAGRPSGRLDVPMEVVAEVGGSSTGVPLVAQMRAQRLREDRGPTRDRLMLGLNAQLWSGTVGRGLHAQVRLDAEHRWNRSSTHTWAMLQPGVVWEPGPWGRFGAALVLGGEVGDPEFSFDQLPQRRGARLRFDLPGRATQISMLGKIDLTRRAWTDTEISVSQTVGTLEPYVILRQNPRTLTLGIRLRAMDVLDRLRARSVERTPAPTRANKVP